MPLDVWLTELTPARSRVVIVSRDEAMTDRLRRALADGFDFLACAEVESVGEHLSRYRQNLVVLDVGHHANVPRELQRVVLGDVAKVLLVGPGELSLDQLNDGLRAGASGYVPVPAALGRMPAIAAAVLRGESALPRRVVGDLLSEFRARPGHVIALSARRHVHVSQREREVLGLVTSGLSNAQISRKLGVAPVTVRSHVARLTHKLRVENRGELANLDFSNVGAAADLHAQA